MSDPIRDACLPCKTCLIRPRLKLCLENNRWMLVCKDKKHLNRVFGRTTLEAVTNWNELYGTDQPQGIVETTKEADRGTWPPVVDKASAVPLIPRSKHP